jgi:hypothetical protein
VTSLVSRSRIVYPRDFLIELRNSKLCQPRPNLLDTRCARSKPLSEKDFPVSSILNKNWIPTLVHLSSVKKPESSLKGPVPLDVGKQAKSPSNMIYNNDVSMVLQSKRNLREMKRPLTDENSLEDIKQKSAVEAEQKIIEICSQNFEESTENSSSTIVTRGLEKVETLNEIVEQAKLPIEKANHVIANPVISNPVIVNSVIANPVTATKTKRKRNRKKPILLEVPSKDCKPFLDDEQESKIEDDNPDSNVSDDVFLNFMKKSFEQNSELFKTTSFDEQNSEILLGRR